MKSRKGTCSAMIKQINDKLEKDANNILREQGLTMSQMAVLMHLDFSESKTAELKELEREFSVAQPTMAGIVKRLCQKGFTKTFQSGEDTRKKIVALTPAGQEKCALNYSNMDTVETSLLAPLSDDEKAQFQKMLSKIKNNLVDGEK